MQTASMLKATLTEYLNSLRAVLERAREHARERETDETVLLGLRLFPDMQPLTFQVQLATELAGRGSKRLAGSTALPDYGRDDRTFDDLLARIDRVLADVGDTEDDAVEAGLAATHHVPLGGDPVAMTGSSYLYKFLLPNFFFHCTAAYAILRHNGVPLGKRDFMAAVTL